VKAIVYERYGKPDVLQLRDIDRPEVAEDGVLVRVHAASVNPVDWHMLTGMPYLARTQAGLRKPKTGRTGTDFAGTVEAVGANVTGFQPGDEVYGARNGALAEYVTVGEQRAIVRKPPNITFEQAAAVPVAAVTALQGLREKGGIQPGHKVLINGASGGVGTFAVQIAKALGADVTGVCSTRNVELVRSLGADRVVDYTREDFTGDGQRYDLMLDNAGNRSWSECKRVLADGAVCVGVGGPKTNPLWGPMGRFAVRSLLTRRADTKFVVFYATVDKDRLTALNELLSSGKVTPVVDRTYELAETADAFRYLGSGHARAKVVVTV
jgi:NADPH:quinone reductase-like Zn-dependent oxidoreductase